MRLDMEACYWPVFGPHKMLSLLPSISFVLRMYLLCNLRGCFFTCLYAWRGRKDQTITWTFRLLVTVVTWSGAAYGQHVGVKAHPLCRHTYLLHIGKRLNTELKFHFSKSCIYLRQLQKSVDWPHWKLAIFRHLVMHCLAWLISEIWLFLYSGVMSHVQRTFIYWSGESQFAFPVYRLCCQVKAWDLPWWSGMVTAVPDHMITITAIIC